MGTHGPKGPGAERKKQGHGNVHCVIPAPVIGAGIDPWSKTPKGAWGPGQKSRLPWKEDRRLTCAQLRSDNKGDASQAKMRFERESPGGVLRDEWAW